MRSAVRKGLVVGALLSTAALTVGPAAAGAAPAKGKAKNTRQLSLQCTKLGNVDVMLKGKGTWTPGHVVGSTRVLKPYEIHLTGTFTPTGGAAEPIDEHFVKPAPKSRKLDECTFQQESTDASGTSSVEGQVKVQYSGKRLP